MVYAMHCLSKSMHTPCPEGYFSEPEKFWFQIGVLTHLSDLEEAVKELFVYELAGEVLLLLLFFFLCKKNISASLLIEILCGERR